MPHHSYEYMNKYIIPISLWLAAIIIMASIQRAPLVSFGPVAEMIRSDLQLSATITGGIAALPLAMFALFSPIAAKLARRFNIERVLLCATLVLIFGLIVRIAQTNLNYLWLGTALISAAIAMCNVLLPALAKRSLPHQIGLVIGTMSATMSISSALAAAMSVPLAQWQSWQWSLGIWLLPAGMATLIWWQIAQRHHAVDAHISNHQNAGSINMWRIPAAWIISIFMGLQSLIFYSTTNFLPAILMEKGMNPLHAGGYSSLFQASSLIGVVIVSRFFARSPHKRIWNTGMTSLMFIGTAGIWLMPIEQTAIWVTLLGAGGSGTFAIVMMLFALRTHHAHEAATLSGMAQTIGYTIAIFGPLGMGALHDYFGTWQASLSILTSLMLIETILAWFAAAPQTIVQTR